jgi:transcriptional regulator with XRE-family HTH domain
MTDTTQTFGKTLRYYRDLKGWTRQRAADAIGVSLNAYGRYEGEYEGHTNPSKETVVKYATGLSPENLDEFLAVSGYPSASLKPVLSPVAMWRLQQIHPDMLEAVEDMIGIFYKLAHRQRLLKPDENRSLFDDPQTGKAETL